MYVLLSFFLAGVMAVLVYYRYTIEPMMKYSEKVPGPKPLPLIGNILEMGFNPKYAFMKAMGLVEKYGTIFRLWFGPKLCFVFIEPKYIECLLSSPKYIEKSFFYEFFRAWLGYGLFLNTGDAWRSRRKLLTPAFHFKILEQFVDVFDNNAKILVDKLSSRLNGPDFDVCQDTELCALDNICETAMGVSINAQLNSDSEYVEAVRNISYIFFERISRLWTYLDFTFRLSPQGRRQKKYLSILHGMTESVIQAKKKQSIEEAKPGNNITSNDCGIKRRLAFLDLLIQASEDGAKLTDEDIKQEVNTFMFAGYDTVSTNLSYCLLCLSKHQDVQDKAVEEVKEIFGESDRAATYQDLQEMKYLDMVIKETLRVYPSVLLFGRHLNENVTIGDYEFPAGSDVYVVPYFLHRHPDYFPDPDRFDPERFSPENSVGRHPYCFVPFSAGPRNCIGQKFAVLEIKSTISRILRNFKIVESDCKDELTFTADFMLKTTNGIKIKLRPRNTDGLLIENAEAK